MVLPFSRCVTTVGRPISSSKPSRRRVSIKIDRCSSPRPATINWVSLASTRRLTLVSSSFCSLAAICREVVNFPSRPANGDVLGPIAICSVGASISITGRASGLSVEAKVSPICASVIPVSWTISPVPASSTSMRLSPCETNILSTLTGVMLPPLEISANLSPVSTLPRWMRPIAYLPW